MMKWYWIRSSPEEREWPNDALPPEVEPMPKWVLMSAAIVVALMLAYAAYAFVVS